MTDNTTKTTKPAKRSGRVSVRDARKQRQNESAPKTPAETETEATVITGEVVPAAPISDPNQMVAALLRDGAQGRGQINLTLEQIPEPIDVGDKTGALDETEAWMLSVCDRAVAEYGRAEVVALKALLTVLKRRLYRAEFKTWEEYAEERLKHVRTWAYKQLDRYEVSMVLSPIGDKLIIESQARELAPVLRNEGEDAVREIWQAVAGDPAASDTTGAKVTADALKQARKRLYPNATPKPRKPRDQDQPGSRYASVVRELGKNVTTDNRDTEAIVKDLRDQLRLTLPNEVYAALVRR